MKRIKWIFLFFAIIAAVSMMGIGIAVAERSLFGIILSVLALVAVFGLGFTFKSKLLKDQ